MFKLAIIEHQIYLQLSQYCTETHSDPFLQLIDANCLVNSNLLGQWKLLVSMLTEPPPIHMNSGQGSIYIEVNKKAHGSIKFFFLN